MIDNDRMEGLTIALNDTWGFRVTITKYHYNPQAKEVETTLVFRIIDHFGLDVNDIFSHTRDIFIEWFILQHFYGVKSFITEIVFDVKIKF